MAEERSRWLLAWGWGEGGVWVSYLRSGTSFYHIPSNAFYLESLKAALCSCSHCWLLPVAGGTCDTEQGSPFTIC